MDRFRRRTHAQACAGQLAGAGRDDWRGGGGHPVAIEKRIAYSANATSSARVPIRICDSISLRPAQGPRQTSSSNTHVSSGRGRLILKPVWHYPANRYGRSQTEDQTCPSNFAAYCGIEVWYALTQDLQRIDHTRRTTSCFPICSAAWGVCQKCCPCILQGNIRSEPNHPIAAHFVRSSVTPQSN